MKEKRDVIKRTGKEDAGALASLAARLWPHDAPAEPEEEFRSLAESADAACFIKYAGDCELDNAESLRFHPAMGFEEANRIICFRKKL